jgi:hypothetical protein
VDPLTLRIASRALVAAGYFSVGDAILYGKWKNKRGVIVRLFTDERGNPAVEIEPVPKGRKKNKIFGLFRMWHADLEKRKVASVEERLTNRYARP